MIRCLIRFSLAVCGVLLFVLIDGFFLSAGAAVAAAEEDEKEEEEENVLAVC